MRIQNHRCVLLLVFILFSVVACKLEIPKSVLPEKKMEDFLYDYHIAKSMGDEIPYNERYKRAIYVRSVYKKHNITSEEFDSSMVWYTRNLDVLSRVYDRVNKRLEQEKEAIDYLVSIREDRPMTSKQGDSIDVWAWRTNYKLSSSPLYNKLTFLLPSDSNFHDRDTLIWQATYLFKDISGNDSLFMFPIMSLQAVYENDSTVYAMDEVKEDGQKQLLVYADTLGKLKEVRGAIYIPMSDSLLYEYFVSDVKLMRYHAQDSLSIDSLALEVDTIPTDTLKEKEITEKKDTVVPTEQEIIIRRDPRALRERGTRTQTEDEEKKSESSSEKPKDEKQENSNQSIELEPSK